MKQPTVATRINRAEFNDAWLTIVEQIMALHTAGSLTESAPAILKAIKNQRDKVYEEVIGEEPDANQFMTCNCGWQGRTADAVEEIYNSFGDGSDFAWCKTGRVWCCPICQKRLWTFGKFVHQEREAYA